MNDTLIVKQTILLVLIKRYRYNAKTVSLVQSNHRTLLPVDVI